MGSWMLAGKVVYCIDTSSLIRAWVDFYPPRNFGGVWIKLDELIMSGRLVAPGEVLEEVRPKGGVKGGLRDWVLQGGRDKKLFPDRNDKSLRDDIEDLQKRIVREYYESVRKGIALESETDKIWADPYVAAFAMSQEPHLVVVTQESRRSEKKQRKKGPSIVDVCIAGGIEYTNILGLIQREDWQFE